METKKLLYRLTGTENPVFLTERENVMIDKFQEILKDEIESTHYEMLEALKKAVEWLEDLGAKDRAGELTKLKSVIEKATQSPETH